MSYSHKKPRYVEKTAKYVEKGSEREPEPRKEERVEKRKEGGRYREKDNGGYDYDPSTITLDTVIPKLPKKEELLSRPNVSDWEEKESALLGQIRTLKDKRRETHNLKYVREKHVASSENEGNVFVQYDVQHQEMIKLRDEKNKLLKQIKPRKDQIQHLSEELEKLNNELKSYEGEGRRSKEALEEQLERLQEQRVRGALNPKQEKAINQEIESVKKDLGSAVSYENIEIRRVIIGQKKAELYKQRDTLYREKKPFSDEFDIVNKKFMEQNEKVRTLISKFDAAKKEKETYKAEIEKGREDFNNSKYEKKREIDDEIDKINDKIDALWSDYDAKVSEFKKQEHLIQHINWMTRQMEYLVNKKKREENQKLWEEKEKKRKEDRDEWEKNKPKKYTPQIKNCEFLIQYCQNLRPKQVAPKVEKQEKLTNEEIEKILNDDKQWKKEKGVSLIQSKKTKDEDSDPKPKKGPKPEPEADKQAGPTVYAHDFAVRNLFEDIKTLPPQNDQELDKVIGELNQRIVYYNKMNSEEKGEVESKQQYKVIDDQPHDRPQKNERKNTKQSKYQPKTEDFPQL